MDRTGAKVEKIFDDNNVDCQMPLRDEFYSSIWPCLNARLCLRIRCILSFKAPPILKKCGIIVYKEAAIGESC